MMISHRKKFVFFHCEKTGGSAISVALAPYCEHVKNLRTDLPINEYLEYMQKRKVGHWGRSKRLEYPYKEHHSMSLYDFPKDYFSFSFVRNPFTRLASAFIGNTRNKDYKDICELVERRHELLEGKPWEGPSSGGNLEPQSKMLDRPIKYVAKYENFLEEWNFIARGLGIDNTIHTVNKVKNYDYKQLYNQRSIDKVVREYKEDFERFGYSTKL